MKKAGLMTGMLLMLLIAGSTSLKAQRGLVRKDADLAGRSQKEINEPSDR